MTHCATLIIAGTLTLVASASVAEAQDKKIYSGTNCQKTGANGTLERSTWGRIFNTDAVNPLTVVCPIVRDISMSEWEEVHITVRNPTAMNLVCTAEARHDDGLLFDDEPVFVTPDGSWEIVGISAPNAVDNGFYQLKCVLPPHGGGLAAGIASYAVVEP